MNDTNSIKKIDLNKTDWRSSRDFFQSLEDELRKLDEKDEKYDFTWVGKRKAILEAGAPINKTLRPDKKSSKNWDTTENLFIEGDNLDALKLLQESYLGKVKMIYIDPPYNTGKDFVYHDNFKVSTEEYDEATEYKDEVGNIQFKKNEKSNGRYHSDWLCMMFPRLKLARNLLREDGVIFISIDDNEVHNLRKISDEVFGEDNFIEHIIWKKRATPPNDRSIGRIHEHILCYSKNYELVRLGLLPRDKKSIQRYSNPDNDPRGDWVASDLSANGKGGRIVDSCVYPILNPNTGKEFMPSEGRCWLFNKDKMQRFIEEGRVDFRTQTGAPFLKRYLKEVRNGLTLPTILDTFGYSSNSAVEIDSLFKKKGVFEYAKPLTLIKALIQVGMDIDSIILDFFAGSGTTAHALIQLNAEDGGNRKWIMVQLPEETPEDSEARKASYKSIPEIARERIRRAGDKIAKEHPDAKVDYGFRSLVIADTNYKEVYKPVSEYKQESLLDGVDNIKADRTDLDLLFGVLTQLALELNRPIETREIEGSTVYLYDYLGEVSGIVACFSEQISDEAIKQIAKLKPLTAVFRESSFADSQAKVNLAEHFRVLSPDTKVRVI